MSKDSFDRYDTPRTKVLAPDEDIKRKKATKPMPIIPERMSLPEVGAQHRILPRVSPFVGSAHCKPELLDKNPVPKPLPRVRFHGEPNNVLKYLRQQHIRQMLAVAPSQMGKEIKWPRREASGFTRMKRWIGPSRTESLGTTPTWA